MGEVRITQDYEFSHESIDFQSQLVEVGNYHCVTQWSHGQLIDADSGLVQRIGNKFHETRSLYNLNFYQVINDRQVRLRTFERGSGETLACGTGAASTAAVCVAKGLVKSNEVEVLMRGGSLQINVKIINNQILVSATGQANTVYTGTYRVK